MHQPHLCLSRYQTDVTHIVQPSGVSENSVPSPEAFTYIPSCAIDGEIRLRPRYHRLESTRIICWNHPFSFLLLLIAPSFVTPSFPSAAVLQFLLLPSYSPVFVPGSIYVISNC